MKILKGDNVLIFGSGKVALGILVPEIIKIGLKPFILSCSTSTEVTEARKKDYERGFYVIEPDDNSYYVPCPQWTNVKYTENYMQKLSKSNLLFTALGSNNLVSLVNIFVELINESYKSDEEKMIIFCENTPYLSDINIKIREMIANKLNNKMAKEYFLTKVGISQSVNYSVIPSERINDEGVPEIVVAYKELPIFFEENEYKNIDSLNTLINSGVIKPAQDFNLEQMMKVYVQLHFYESINFLGGYKGYEIMSQAITDKQIKRQVLESINEIKGVITKKYKNKESYINGRYEKIVNLFNNIDFTDEISRNCRDPLRKLKVNERIVGPAILVIENGGCVNSAVHIIATTLLYAEGIFQHKQIDNKFDIEEYINMLVTYSKDLGTKVMKAYCNLKEKTMCNKEMI